MFLLGYKLSLLKNYFELKTLLEIYFSPGQWLLDQDNQRYQDLRTYSKNQYIYAKGYISNLWKTKNVWLSLILTGQIASCNLQASETLGIGGYNSVRGYYERQVNTDSGIIANLELISKGISFLKNKNWQDAFKFLLFLDFGLGSLYKPLPLLEQKNTYLLGWGPGIRYAINPKMLLRLDLGIRGKNNILNYDGPKCRLHFSFNLSY